MPSPVAKKKTMDECAKENKEKCKYPYCESCEIESKPLFVSGNSEVAEPDFIEDHCDSMAVEAQEAEYDRMYRARNTYATLQGQNGGNPPPLETLAEAIEKGKIILCCPICEKPDLACKCNSEDKLVERCHPKPIENTEEAALDRIRELGEYMELSQLTRDDWKLEDVIKELKDQHTKSFKAGIQQERERIKPLLDDVEKGIEIIERHVDCLTIPRIKELLAKIKEVKP